jgi:hypothetical protein
MPETDGGDVEVDERRIDGRLRRVEIQRCPGDDDRGLEDLACGVPIAERGDQQHEAGRLREVGHTRREGMLETLGQRHAAGHRWLLVLLPENRRQLE